MMTYDEFLNEVNAYYQIVRGKGMEGKQRSVMLQFIARYNEKDMQELFDKLVETCKTFPKVAHVKEAAQAAQLQVKHETQEGRQGCSACNYTTWKRLRVRNPDTGHVFPAVESCECTPRKGERPPEWRDYEPIRDEAPPPEEEAQEEIPF